MKMTITMPETRTVLFKDLEEGDFFIYGKDLFRKLEDVFLADAILKREIEGTRDSEMVYNAEMFDSYDGGGLESFTKDAEVIPVDVEIKVLYQ